MSKPSDPDKLKEQRSIQIGKNSRAGKLWEDEVFRHQRKDEKLIVRQKSIFSCDADGGKQTRMIADGIKSSKNGETIILEAKSSQTAPLSKNQKAVQASIKENGTCIMGDKVLEGVRMVVIRKPEKKSGSSLAAAAPEPAASGQNKI